MFADLFGHMSCSLRLLHLCKKASIFQNVCRQIEVLSKRKFSHAHLAQMKYILPKSVCIDRVLVHDKKSLCMVPDMKITLKFEVVEDCSGESADLALRRYFKSKLIDFFDMHPEDMPTQKSTSSYKPGKRVLDFSLMEDNDGLGIEVDKLESIRALHGSIR
ncbi:CDT1-like protein a, chloroplastic [Glycine soja]|uniref:CDT1-like protein a, chloroplastic n=1 Tax=Glycine soja TaxID=3848 RepID=A0A0B2RKY8_GLYSO|nr:CDT1-like protein a, chloroplastic [Glycine soja]